MLVEKTEEIHDVLQDLQDRAIGETMIDSLYQGINRLSLLGDSGLLNRMTENLKDFTYAVSLDNDIVIETLNAQQQYVGARILSVAMSKTHGTVNDNIFFAAMAKEAVLFDEQTYRSDPFVANVKLVPFATAGQCASYRAVLLHRDDVIHLLEKRRYTQNDSIPLVGVMGFDCETTFLISKQTSYQVTPQTIFCNRRCVEAARGRVLCGGADMGYLPYMTAMKDDVQSVTVVEQDADLADYFRRYILPQIPNKDKITVVVDSILHHLATTSETYDSCVGNLIFMINGVYQFAEMMRYLGRYPNLSYAFVHEQEIMYEIRSILLLLMMTQMNGHTYKDVNPSNPPDMERDWNLVAEMTRRCVIAKPEDVLRQISDENIKRLLVQGTNE